MRESFLGIEPVIYNDPGTIALIPKDFSVNGIIKSPPLFCYQHYGFRLQYRPSNLSFATVFHRILDFIRGSISMQPFSFLAQYTFVSKS
jgi:hypothetical protein